MKQYRSVVAILALIFGTVLAYPEQGPPETIVDLNATVDKAVRQQTAEYIAIIYDDVKEPKPDGNLVIEELIAASLPESLRQDVASELSDKANDGTLSAGLKERIRQHILDWMLQYVPEDLRVDIATVLDEYRNTGQVIGNNEQLIVRIRQYVASLESDVKRNKRGFWSGLLKATIKYLANFLFDN